MSYYVVYVTTSNKNEANIIAKTTVRENLAACANILGKVTSVFRWENSIQNDDEYALILKTSEKNLEKITSRIKHLHSYSCPCIIGLKIEYGNADFLNWISEQVKE